MRWLADFCADLSLVDFWPVRALLLAAALLLLVVLVWRFATALRAGCSSRSSWPRSR
ncbi:hypothetical protein [Saccharopolyspora hattusasensis]|uniref:hypothetical protein n=1 Tax=Saccharopolyspora hattusasensis TaxID=1128679 RepID=UPI003D993AD5